MCQCWLYSWLIPYSGIGFWSNYGLPIQQLSIHPSCKEDWRCLRLIWRGLHSQSSFLCIYHSELSMWSAWWVMGEILTSDHWLDVIRVLREISRAHQAIWSSTMVRSEAPSCNSHRVQRANRINSIEQGRLLHKISLLDKERVRSIRLLNQDMRVINLTMDFIQSSSGKSPEGRSPDESLAEREREEISCFLYGDRLNSRRFGKNIRKDSPGSPTNSQRSSAENDISCNTWRTQRFHSSPAKRDEFSNRSPSPYGPKEADDVGRPQTASGDLQRSKMSSSRHGFSRPSSSRSSFRGSSRRPSLYSTAEIHAQIETNRKLNSDRSSSHTQSPNGSRTLESEPKRLNANWNNGWVGSSPVTQSIHQRRILENRKQRARDYLSFVNEKVSMFNKKYPVDRTYEWRPALSTLRSH